LIEDTSCFDVVTVVVQPAGGSTPAAAKHAVAVIVELVAPAEVTVLVTAILQDASSPAPVGKAGGLHWAAAGAEAAAEATGAEAIPRKATEAKAVPAAIAAITQRRTSGDPVMPVYAVNEDRSVLADPPDELVAGSRLGQASPRRRIREQSDDNDQADHTAGPPSRFPEINNRLRRTFKVSNNITLVLEY